MLASLSISLLQMSQAEKVAAKAAHIAEVDPDGLILTLVSVCCVFGVLTLLVIAYSITGGIFIRRAAKEAAKAGAPAEDEEVVAAMAAALQRYEEETASAEIHDEESGVITIKK